MFISRRGTRRACDLQRKKVFASEHFTIRIQLKTIRSAYKTSEKNLCEFLKEYKLYYITVGNLTDKRLSIFNYFESFFTLQQLVDDNQDPWDIFFF